MSLALGTDVTCRWSLLFLLFSEHLQDFLLRALQQLNAALEAKARRLPSTIGAIHDLTYLNRSFCLKIDPTPQGNLGADPCLNRRFLLIKFQVSQVLEQGVAGRTA